MADQDRPLAAGPSRSAVWRWSVCGLLLLATMLNYMDRQTLVMASTVIVERDEPGGSSARLRSDAELRLSTRQYSRIEMAFSWAFACGGLVFGLLADRRNIYLVYPLVVLIWSSAGFGSGLAETFGGMLLCRSLLGLAESGHWPCALRTTQWLLPARDRSMGNALLQSGASLGAVATPVVFRWIVADGVLGSWRRPFFVIGGLGMIWCVIWAFLLRPRDLPQPARESADSSSGREPFWNVLADRRFVVLVVVVVAINVCWHFFRVWTVLFLTRSRGYSDRFAHYFTSAYYLVTDLGALFAGALASALAHRGVGVHTARKAVYLGCAVLTALAAVSAALVPRGPLLIGLLLLVGFGSLGLFPIYYSLSQELTVRDQGKLTGVLTFCAWSGAALMQSAVGNAVSRTNSYTLAMALNGLAPLLGFAALLIGWPTLPTAADELPARS